MSLSLLQDLVEEACLTWSVSVWLLYVAAARLGGGGMFDQCGTICVVTICLYVAAARLGGGGMFDQCGYYMSLLQDLVEGACLTVWLLYVDAARLQDLVVEACLISVVTICHCCKTWWRRHV